jgi:signal transduction histidine kinase
LNIKALKIRKIAPVVVPFIILTVLITGLSITKIQKILIDQAYSKLTTSRDIKKQQIEEFFNRKIIDIEILAQSNCIKNLVISLDNPDKYLNDKNIEEYERFLKDYIKKYNYMDMLLISADSGIIKYTQFKELSIEKNLSTKKQSNSQLHILWKRVKETEETRFVDIRAYKPNGGRETMYIATPVYIDGKFSSILVFQISDRSLSKIINFNKGYGYTQKDYLIGSDSIHIADDGTLCAATHSLRIATQNQKTIQMGKCTTDVQDKALCGQDGEELVEDCNGKPVLSAYSPLDIGQDLNWAIISEIDEDVVLRIPNSIRDTSIRDSTFFIVIILIVILFFIYKESIHEEEVAQQNREMNETLQSRVAEEVIKNKENQEILFQQSKMASMGEMIGNIAHQWRQPLNALSALNVSLSMKYSAGKLTEDDVSIFKEKSNYLIQRMSDTINDFRNFFYPDKSVERFRVDKAIDDAINFIKSSYRINNIKIINYSSCTVDIKNHKNELIQVLLNIFNNSKDAIKEFNSQNGIVIIDVIILENSLKITIQDNGGGIDQKIIDRVFEPYFTTKFKDEGTGIGLYMSKMIVEESMGGRLKLENRDSGVLTTIKLPIN